MNSQSSTPVQSLKRKNPLKTNLILTAILVALGSFAYLYEYKYKGKKLDGENAKLLSVPQDVELERVTLVQNAKGVSTELQCKEHCKLSDPNAKWDIVKPISFKADEGNVGAYVNSIISATVHETLTLDPKAIESELKGFGLSKDLRENQKVIIKIKSDPNPYIVFFGDSAAVGNNLYAYVEGPGQKLDSVRIISSHLKTNLEKPLTHWRTKRLFDFAASEVEGLKLTNSTGTIQLKKQNGDWYFAQSNDLADNETLDTFVTGLAFTNVTDYASEDKNKDRTKLRLGTKPKYALQISLLKKTPILLEVFETFDKENRRKLYATLDSKNFVVELDQSGTERFAKKAADFRFKNLITVKEKQNIHKIGLSVAGHKFEVQKEGASWKLASGSVERFEPTTIDIQLNKVGAARVAEFMGKRAIPSGNHELSSWTLHISDPKETKVFSVWGTTSSGEYYVKMPSGEVVKLERGTGAAIPSKIEVFQKADVTASSNSSQPAEKKGK